MEIYLGEGKMIGAGDPVKIHDLHSLYYSSHFYSFGRILKRKQPEENVETDTT